MAECQIILKNVLKICYTSNYPESMEKISILFLQITIVLIGIGALAFMLWEPHLEGRNAHATPFEVYFNDPFLTYAYTASIAFFVALYQAFRLLGYIRQNKIFSQDSAKALRTIQYCAISLIGFIGAPLAYLCIVQPGDDIAGGVAMGIVTIFISAVFATTAAVCTSILQSKLLTVCTPSPTTRATHSPRKLR